MTDDETIRLGDRYELGGLLGRGGMADVRVGRDLRLGRTVAIKQLRTDLASDDTFQARFRREAQSAAALNHPSVVAVYDTGEATDAHGNHVLYIVMEYVEGQTLREIMRDDRKILPERALSITADVLSALDYSHRSGIIHRDIKPANVMLTPEGKVKVMDFGIARAIADASSAMTQTAAVIGTAQYLSPEQARGETVDARSDIYSTGCLLYELLTGRPPFVGESPVSVAYQHVREDARPPSQLNPDVSEAVDHIVAKALAKRTDDRYQSADEMRRDIERALAGHQVDAPTMAVAGLGAAAAGATAVAPAAGGTGTMTPVSHRDDDEAPDRKALWIGLAVLAVIILGLVGWGIYQASQPDDVAQVKVPDVTGQDVETATRALENAKFVVGETTEKTSADVDKGQVISTDPEAGSDADEGSTVDLVVSSGPEQVTIPSLDGYSYDRAKKLLESDQFGLKVKKATQDSNEPKDSVLNSDPPAGQAVDKGTTVTLIVSKGQVTVPNVVGTDQAAATKTLEDAGFKVNVVEDPNAQGPEGQVTAQSVPAGEQRSPGTTIEITVIAKQDQGDADGGDVLGGDEP
jgi:serine/threonine-protein kinase